MVETVTKNVQADLSGLTPAHRFQVLACNDALKQCRYGEHTVLNVGSAEDPASLSALYNAVNLDCVETDAVPDREWHPSSLPNFVHGDARDMPFPDKQFRCVVVGELLEHVSDKDACTIMREAHRVLVDQGQCIVTLPADHRPAFCQHGKHGALYTYVPGITTWHSNVWDAGRLSQLFKMSRFVPVKVGIIMYPFQGQDLARGFGVVLCRAEDVDLDPHPMPQDIGRERDEEIRHIMQSISPQRIMCTGVASNDNIETWHSWYPDAQFIGFDLFSALSEERAFDERCVPPEFVQSFQEYMMRMEGIDCAIVSGDTRETMEAACLKHCGDALVDFAYLGGGHSYDTVLNELILCQEFVRPGGIVMVEDRTLKSVDAAVDNCKGMGRWDVVDPYMWVLHL